MASLLSCKRVLVRPSVFLGTGLGQGSHVQPSARDCGGGTRCIQAVGAPDVVTKAQLGVTVKAIANKATSRGREKRGDKVTARVVAAGSSALASTVDRADLDMLELKRSLLESQWALPSLEENEDSMPSTSGRDFESIEENYAPDLKASAKKSRSRKKKVSKSVQSKIKSRSSNSPGPARRRRLQSQKERISAQGEPVAMFSSARLKQSSEAARRAATARAEFSFDESLSLFEECLNTHQLLTPDEEKYLCKKVHDGQQLRAAKER
jgi:hypothetical protein